MSCSRAFTLMEIMLVVIVVGILATMVASNFSGMSTDARISRAQADVAQIRTQLGLFESRYGRYPSQEDGGLLALIERPSSIDQEDWRRLSQNPAIDPWGNPYVYLSGVQRVDDSLEYNLYSIGANKADDRMSGDDIF